MIFFEKPFRFGPYIKFEDFDALSSDVPRLSILRVEMERVHPGMSDFIMRVATPKYAGVQKSNTIVSIRGNRTFTKFDTIVSLAKLIVRQMLEKGDATHDWRNADIDRLADLLYGPAKYFAANTLVEHLKFSTEAL